MAKPKQKPEPVGESAEQRKDKPNGNVGRRSDKPPKLTIVTNRQVADAQSLPQPDGASLEETIARNAAWRDEQRRKKGRSDAVYSSLTIDIPLPSLRMMFMTPGFICGFCLAELHYLLRLVHNTWVDFALPTLLPVVTLWFMLTLHAKDAREKKHKITHRAAGIILGCMIYILIRSLIHVPILAKILWK